MNSDAAVPVVQPLDPADPDDVEYYYRLDAAAFGMRYEPEQVAAKREVIDPTRFYRAVLDGDAAGVAGSFPFDLTLPGGATVPVSGVSDVGVLPTHRRRGVLRALMTRLLDDAAQRGEPAAVLTASEATIYGRFGFGVATMCRFAAVPVDRSGFRPDAPMSRGRLRLVERADAAAMLADVHERAARGRPASLSRSSEWWQVVLGDVDVYIGGHRDHQVVVHHDDGGRPDAYGIYRIAGHWPVSGPANAVEVWEVMGVDASSELAVWRYLFDHDLVVEVHAQVAPDNLLGTVLADPRALRYEAERDFLWLRPLDVAALLSARSYAVDGAVVVEVIDGFRPEGSGRYQVESAGGASCCERDDAASADLVADVAELGSCALGGVPWRRLVRAGRVVEATPGAAARADAMFGVDPLPWCSTRF